jgi:TetR/AcrR family hemagglutinin/protease transcriptional regulator
VHARRVGVRRRAARLQPEERRAQLVECALRAFARRGLGAARHADVAAEAEVSLPAVFHYFPTRGALVDAVLEEVRSFFLDMVRRAYERPGTAAERLLFQAREFARGVDTHPHHARIWLDWSTAVRDEVWRRYLAFYDEALAMVTRTIQEGQREASLTGDVPAEDAARLVIGAAHVVMQMKLRGTSERRIVRTIEGLVTLFHGARGSGRMRRHPPHPP